MLLSNFSTQFETDIIFVGNITKKKKLLNNNAFDSNVSPLYKITSPFLDLSLTLKYYIDFDMWPLPYQRPVVKYKGITSWNK